jgi:hypothetical protein
MRKAFTVLAAAAFALAILAGGCAKDKSPPRLQPAKKGIAGTEKKAAPKPRAKLFTGTIEDLDEAAGTLNLKGPKGEMSFQARNKVKEQLGELEIGDKVIVKHDGQTALSIVKPRTSKTALALYRNEEPGKSHPDFSNQ